MKERLKFGCYSALCKYKLLPCCKKGDEEE